MANRGADGDWVDAIDLRAGDQLVAVEGTRIAVASLGIRIQDVRAFNLTVDDIHTYYVRAGNTSVLVHNDNATLCKLLGINQVTPNRLVGDAYRDHIADSLVQRGLNVITERQAGGLLRFDTPDGPRKFDIGLPDLQGNVTHYIETKSGTAGKDPRQAKKDKWLEKTLGINITCVFDGHSQ